MGVEGFGLAEGRGRRHEGRRFGDGRLWLSRCNADHCVTLPRHDLICFAGGVEAAVGSTTSVHSRVVTIEGIIRRISDSHWFRDTLFDSLDDIGDLLSCVMP